LSIGKSADAEKASTTQHSPKQFSQSASRLTRPTPSEGWSDKVRGLLLLVDVVNQAYLQASGTPGCRDAI
jgi:hypothetical protein